ncbi:MAG: acetylornithine carbamoyltransferase [Saprospiraceae bacterium]|jgi:N-succinyl-L-ornithine transcarbamylase|nr:acetylornithine carbamoyltransferase [Saprospiraceae bacterium]MBL0023521.1 acetylornithine carbamoyltransferase [Saprospiraceae bacterium]
MKSFISSHDVADIPALLDLALRYKNNPLADKTIGAGKRLGLIFMNPSLRTRISTQIAGQNLGMDSYVLNVGTDNWQLEFEEGSVMNGSTVEHIKDAAPIFGEYFDIIGLRTFPGLKDRSLDYKEHVISNLQKYSGIPVLSLESATLHPLQSLTDLITIKENWKSGKKPKVVMTWAPHIKPIPQCVANSFAQWVNAWGEAEFVITHPEGYELNKEFTEGAEINHDQSKALEGADFVYVKNWSSYADYGKVLTSGDGWMLTKDHMSFTNQAHTMHCLPVRRNVELSDEILDHSNCLTTDQAANRVWAAQAVLSELLRGKS